VHPPPRLKPMQDEHKLGSPLRTSGCWVAVETRREPLCMGRLSHALMLHTTLGFCRRPSGSFGTKPNDVNKLRQTVTCSDNNSYRYHPLPFCLSAIPDCRSRCGKVGGWLPVARGEKCRYNAYPQCAESRPPSVMAYGHEVTRRNTRTHFVAGAHHARRWGRTGARRRVGRRSRHIHAKQE